ncbi:helix-turn-helix transcriptional regulator [Roseisolibacter agri]|nr:LuxR family transcriptional regulator [Roseisolibacter agri]
MSTETTRAHWRTGEFPIHRTGEFRIVDRTVARPRPAPADQAPSLTPSPADLRLDALGHALRVLLSPLDATGLTAWREAVHAALLRLFGAERVALHFPVHPDGAPASVLDDWTAPHLTPDAIAALHAAAQRDDLPADRAPLLRLDFGGADEARVWIEGGAVAAGVPDAHTQQLARTVLPALRAGLATWAQLGARRAALGRLLDTGDGSALLIGARGEVAHESAACRRLLSDETPADAECVRQAAARLALGAHAADRGAARGQPHAPVSTVVRTARHRYELACTRTRSADDRSPLALVTVQRQVPRPLTDDEIRARFGLTPRELEVARLLAEGLTNQELAERLGVSFFTARNHVERLLPKLGAANRACVGGALIGA